MPGQRVIRFSASSAPSAFSPCRSPNKSTDDTEKVDDTGNLTPSEEFAAYSCPYFLSTARQSLLTRQL